MSVEGMMISCRKMCRFLSLFLVSVLIKCDTSRAMHLRSRNHGESFPLDRVYCPSNVAKVQPLRISLWRQNVDGSVSVSLQVGRRRRKRYVLVEGEAVKLSKTELLVWNTHFEKKSERFVLVADPAWYLVMKQDCTLRKKRFFNCLYLSENATDEACYVKA